ncbi:type VI secretion system baseplate subunit TssF [Roseateles violae]|uniref:Type VI secretion system baseplate subunit TssF n=1 Tax=Roseateles violae TaxID=3058042 RepID=A0ABT8DUG0_9BURK|nr:type VI secretion system baseplate subunit TssF [Pelomonas sp. PFR6]MDN3920027.1 type VI secretion system baseplate subunit TssF [Pelomonas sp. PFR6]
MDPRLLRLYKDELAHLREVGAEFAQEFPKIAARLGMEGMEVSDPYVERLLEGFAFLTARVQLKLESEQPRLIAHLLEASYPNFLAPVPSMLVARCAIDPADPNLVKGYKLPRGSALLSELARGQDTHCEFRTAHELTLWPIELLDVRYFSHAPDAAVARLPQAQSLRGGLSVRLRCGGGLLFSQLGLDRLAFYISAPDDQAMRLHELLMGAPLGTLVRAAQPEEQKPLGAAGWRGPESLSPLGFGADEALLPESLRAFSGYRLLQETAALPQRLLFFECGALAERLATLATDEVELLLLLGRGDATLEARVDAHSLALFCTPAINLFRKRLDRIQLGPGAWEYHVVPDRTRPMDYEVHSVETVTGFGTGLVAQQKFLPLYASHHESGSAHGYYTVRREPRLLSTRQQQQGTRSSYVGEEVYLSLLDPHHAPYREDVRQLSLSAWVSNRDLPTLLPQVAAMADKPQWRLESPGPVTQVELLRGPTRPTGRRPSGELGWSLVNHLTLNHLSLLDEPPPRAAASLRKMLSLYAPPEDAAWRRQIEGVRGLRARSVVRRLPLPGPLSFGTGVELELELDELAFQGSSAFLFASLLERFFARHAAINSFTQLSLKTPQRGELMRWPPRLGLQDTV